MGDKLAGMEQDKSGSPCQDMADTGRCGTNAAWHLLPNNGEAKAARNAPLPHTLQTLLSSTAQYALALSLLLAPLYALEQRIQHF
jgi:hypothetical protein